MLNLQFTGFTNGPWQVTATKNGIHPSGFYRVGTGDYGVIADVIDLEQNATLISVAPELLAECVRLQKEINLLRLVLRRIDSARESLRR